MRDAERRLLRCIGGIDDELILEADYMRFHPKRWGHLLALAACLVLVLTIPAFLNGGEAGPKYAASPQEPAANEAAGVEGTNAATEGLVQGEISLGGLTPGMTRDQVRDLLGEPALATQAADSDQPQRWSYEYLTVNFHDFDGTVREIRAFAGCGLSLSNGIGFDSTAEDVARLCPDAYVTEADLDEDKYDTAYQVYPGDWTLTIGTLNGAVVAIILEDLSDPMLEALTVPVIMLHEQAKDAYGWWRGYEVTNRAAKRICTVLTISEPEEGTAPVTGITVWMDFGNGTAVSLLGNDFAAIYTYEGTFNVGNLDNLSHYLTGQFLGLDDAVAQALENPTETEGWDQDEISLGGLTPGMTHDQVWDLLGEPALATQAADSDQPQSWSYEYLTVNFHDFDGTVREIRAFDGCGLSLSNGIGFDSTAEDVARLYPDAYVTEADLDEVKYDTAYQVYPGDWTLTIGTLNGTVAVIILEDLSDPMWKALTTNEITIYQLVDDQWQTTQVIDKAAKYICTVLTISEPEQTELPASEPMVWLDFGTGAVVGLLGDDCAVVARCEGEFEPFVYDNLSGKLKGRFQGLDDYVAQALENPTATWDDTPVVEPTYNTDPIVATESIAGLKLGMSDREVQEILGEPDKVVSMSDYEGLVEMWTYDGVQLVMGTLGDGWFLNEIYPGEGCTLSSGIGIGSTAEEVEAAYPGIIGQEDLVWDYVYSTNEDLSGLYLAMSDGRVSSIMFGPWVLDFVMENTPEESPAEEPELEP